MSKHTELIEEYRAARRKFNVLSNERETFYHKRQRIILESSRKNSYKYALLQSKRRVQFAFRRKETVDRHRYYLSNDIYRIFQMTKTVKDDKIINMPHKNSSQIFPNRNYPSIVNLHSTTSKQSINIHILNQTIFLGQFDKKFLISKYIDRKLNNKIQIVIFDQHAISERILLEQLQKDSFHRKSFQLSSPMIIKRNPRFLYTDEQIGLLERTGFSFTSISSTNLLIRSIPCWLLTIRQRHLSTSIFDDILYDTINNILSQHNYSYANNLDLIIYDTLKSVACHNAIKFNDILSRNESNQLLNELKSCSMPFICAHGRTSAAMLWEYDNKYDKYQVDLAELKQIASIQKWFKES